MIDAIPERSPLRHPFGEGRFPGGRDAVVLARRALVGLDEVALDQASLLEPREQGVDRSLRHQAEVAALQLADLLVGRVNLNREVGLASDELSLLRLELLDLGQEKSLLLLELVEAVANLLVLLREVFCKGRLLFALIPATTRAGGDERVEPRFISLCVLLT